MPSQRPVTIHFWAGNQMSYQMSFKRYLVSALSLRVCGQFRHNSHIC